ncbi:MAG TPA: enoyl-CoA hydratase/isomerase family protein [Solirubrobacterales bacterium]|nr:enoyl-CoA hydratase/isomerase family protein [Solirubrobacterales bacterium]
MELIRLTREGPLAILTIDSPPLNLFDARLISELKLAVEEVRADPPRALLIRADGKVVSGGVNVQEFEGLTAAQGSALWSDLLGLVDRIEALPLPVLFAAHGLTLTAAFELSLACDLIIAGESAKFGLVEIVVGLTPSMGGPQRLAERAGSGRARQLVMTGDLFDAATLERWNVVNEVVADQDLREHAERLAIRLANGPTRAHAMTKRILRAYVEGGVPAADRVTRRDAADLFETEDLRGAVRTFLEEGPGNATYEGK